MKSNTPSLPGAVLVAARMAGLAIVGTLECIEAGHLVLRDATACGHGQRVRIIGPVHIPVPRPRGGTVLQMPRRRGKRDRIAAMVSAEAA